MKKIIISLLVVLCISFLASQNNDQMIRFRIIANSNSLLDQNIKSQVKTQITSSLMGLINETDSKEQTKNKIIDNISLFEKDIINIFEKNNYAKTYKINYGLNYFPKKTIQGKTYEEGKYESLVITLGEGKGDNWWCILFPPICLLEAEENNTNEIKYDFFLLNLFN